MQYPYLRYELDTPGYPAEMRVGSTEARLKGSVEKPTLSAAPRPIFWRNPLNIQPMKHQRSQVQIKTLHRNLFPQTLPYTKTRASSFATSRNSLPPPPPPPTLLQTPEQPPYFNPTTTAVPAMTALRTLPHLQHRVTPLRTSLSLPLPTNRLSRTARARARARAFVSTGLTATKGGLLGLRTGMIPRAHTHTHTHRHTHTHTHTHIHTHTPTRLAQGGRLGVGGGGGQGQGMGKGVWRAFSSLWGVGRRAGVGRGRGIVGREGKTELLAWSRGMKVRSSVKKLCEGCKVWCSFFFSFFLFFCWLVMLRFWVGVF